MNPSTEHIARLLYRQQAGTIKNAEQLELDEWLRAHPRQAARLASVHENRGLAALLDARSPHALAALKTELYQSIREQLELPNDTSINRVRFLNSWVKYAAAIIILFGVGAYLWNNYNKAPQSNTATITPSSHDILPGGNKATLTLADGRTIVLDSAQNGQLTTENGSDIIKKGGEIIYAYPKSSAKKYDAGQIRNNTVTYNTMSTPRGGQYQLTLNDGTKVWLNSSSTIKYPLVFHEKERRVVLTGEAYFEVAKSQFKPFYVETENMTIQVLGTHFNVNAYKDEPSTRTTLLEGKVSVKLNNNKSALLKPGQQAEIITSSPESIKVNNNIDLYSVTAWQKGLFEFRNADLPTIARQLSRWYNIDIKVGTDTKAVKLGGGILKNAPFSGVLKMLEANNIKYTWKGKTITLESF